MRTHGRKIAFLGAAFSCILLLVSGTAFAAALPLPDGRAWEMVSPLDKNGGEINGIGGTVPNEGLPEGGVVQAAADGNSITYLSLLAFPGLSGGQPLGAPLASQYLSTRYASEWTTEDLATAMNSKTYPAAGFGAPYRAFSTDLARSLMLGGGYRPIENKPLTPDAPPRYMNYYLRDRDTTTLRALLTSTPFEGPEEFRLELLGVNPDLTHAVFETIAALSPGATRQSEGNLYEWADGQFQPINVSPEATNSGETSGGGAELGSRFNESHTISDDGMRVFWSQPATRRLFVREGIGTNHATTVQIDESRGGVDEGGRGEFATASVDGSEAFFTDSRRLTPDATAGDDPNHQDLYMFDVDSHRLSDLTIDNTDLGGAAVLGVLGASDDGSYVYFVAEGGLPNTGAIAGRDNLYMWHEGAVRFLAALVAKDSVGANREPTFAHDWVKSGGLRTARVSADGRYVLFMSAASLTGYDNRDMIHPEVLDEEVFLYDAVANNFTCVSCSPSGGSPVGPSGFPGGTPWRIAPEIGTYEPRVLSEDGSRVFFDSKDTLVPQDTNGAQDVYEWERGGTNGCQLQGGCVYLLSGATSTSDSSFVDASLNGNDAFFITREELVPQDTDQLRDLYDARVGGGLPAPPVPLPACEGEGCLPQASAPSAPGSLASTTFSGTGNIVPASRPKVKPTAKKKPAKKAKKRASKRKKRKRKANTRRGSSSSVRGRR
jgi:hypothetical protein